MLCLFARASKHCTLDTMHFEFMQHCQVIITIIIPCPESPSPFLVGWPNFAFFGPARSFLRHRRRRRPRSSSPCRGSTMSSVHFFLLVFLQWFVVAILLHSSVVLTIYAMDIIHMSWRGWRFFLVIHLYILSVYATHVSSSRASPVPPTLLQ